MYELSHHGILGQKWGKRNGPPYPIDAGDHSASEKKAGWRKSLEQGIEVHKRISNAQKAAGLEKRIDKLEGKVQTESRQAKIDKLTARRNEKISDLSEDEIELGRKYLQRDELINTASLAGMMVAGTPGMLVADLGASVVYNFTKEGKATNELAKKVMNENKERMAKRDAEQQAKAQKESSNSNGSYGDYTRRNKQSLMDDARKKGSFDMDFAEVKNDEWDNKRTMSEYSKYLDDPEGWMRSPHR